VVVGFQELLPGCVQLWVVSKRTDVAAEHIADRNEELNLV